MTVDQLYEQFRSYLYLIALSAVKVIIFEESATKEVEKNILTERIVILVFFCSTVYATAGIEGSTTPHSPNIGSAVGTVPTVL